jgi:quercetin dioxygenase-like cupin family protein
MTKVKENLLMLRNRRYSSFAAFSGAILVAMALVGQALATPASGVISGTVLARADFVERVDVKFKIGTSHGIHVSNARGAGEVVVQEIVLAPDGSTGWHTHPGPAVAVIKSGMLRVTDADGCASRTYSAGEAFVDPGQGHVHRAINPGSENAVVYVTYFDVPSGSGPRIDADDPGC